jgi:Fur family ferric uptake transcriptional regulator
MNRPETYNTKQSEAVLDYIASTDGNHVTVAQIVEHFGTATGIPGSPAPVGRTTIYRHLDKLVESGKVRRYTIDGMSCACYQYINEEEVSQEHFHLKCEICGVLLHLQCDTLNEMWQHIFQKHEFQVNMMKTVFYGKCKDCLKAD